MANELISECESLESPQHGILLSSFRPTRKKRLKACCKPTYNMRRVKSKGAIVLLIRNYFLIGLLYYLIINNSAQDPKPYFITWSITVPLVGWLADVYFGRYKMILFSMWIMWAAFILSTVSSVLAQIADNHTSIEKYITLSLNIIVALTGLVFTKLILSSLD